MPPRHDPAGQQDPFSNPTLEAEWSSSATALPTVSTPYGSGLRADSTGGGDSELKEAPPLMGDEMTSLEAALAAAARGWPSLPIQPGTKRPHLKLTEHGVSDATTHEATIWKWYVTYPDAGVGIATGYPGPDVLDIDDHAHPRAIEAEAAARAAGAPSVKTARGVQFYFAGSEGRTRETGYGELRRQGSYVLAPPSVHPSGVVYRWAQSPNGHLPQVPTCITAGLPTAGAGEAPKVDKVPPGSMYAHLKDRAIRLVRSGILDVDAIERALLAEFEAVRAPGVEYVGGSRDTRRLAKWAARSEIARRESADGWKGDEGDDPSEREGTHPTSKPGRHLELVKFSDVKPERVQFIEGGRIALGKLTFLAGVPGLGKSTYSIMIAAKVAQTHPVLMLNAEDGDGDTMKPRLAAAGADMGNVYTARLRRGEDADGGLVLPDDADRLREAIEKAGIKLVVVDPIMAHLDGTINSHKDQDVRQALLPLSRMGEDLGCTFLVVGHLKKGDEAEVLHQIGGSTGFGGAARGALFFARHPEDPAGERGVERVLVHVKNNNGPLQPVEDYYVEPLDVDVPRPGGGTVRASTSRLVYRGVSTMSNRDALAGTEEKRGGNRSEPKPEDRARWTIREMLRRLGAQKGEDIEAIVRAAGVGKHAVQAARAGMNKNREIEKFQEGGKGAHLWRLTGSPQDTRGGGEVLEIGVESGRGGEVLDSEQQTLGIPVVEPSP